MRLTPTERDRLLLFTAAELARSRRARGLRLNVPEATALIADAVCEAARDGARLAEAIEAGRAVLGPGDVLPGVADIVTEVMVEAVFDDGTRLAVVTDPIGGGSLGAEAPGAVIEPVRAGTPRWGTSRRRTAQRGTPPSMRASRPARVPPSTPTARSRRPVRPPARTARWRWRCSTPRPCRSASPRISTSSR
nr:hypothetical protein GCM10020093_033200 [Planobispora longispora]